MSSNKSVHKFWVYGLYAITWLSVGDLVLPVLTYNTWPMAAQVLSTSGHHKRSTMQADSSAGECNRAIHSTVSTLVIFVALSSTIDHAVSSSRACCQYARTPQEPGQVGRQQAGAVGPSCGNSQLATLYTCPRDLYLRHQVQDPTTNAVRKQQTSNTKARCFKLHLMLCRKYCEKYRGIAR
jgi:hypothetical protein